MSSTFLDSAPHLVLAWIVVAAAQIVYALFGFGSGLIMVAGLALVVPDLADVVVLVLLVNVPIELFVVVRSRRAIEWTGVARLAVGIAVGIPIGTAILSRGRPDVLLGVLGAVLVVLGPVLLRPPAFARPITARWVEPWTGVVSGILTGLFGTGGPPVVAHFRLAGKDKTGFRGNLMALFLLMTAVRLPAYALGGLVTAPRVATAVAVAPAVLLGAWFGQRAHVSVSEERFRSGVAVGLVAIGVVLIAKSLG